MDYSYTTWTSDLNTEHVLIDQQHRQLIAAVNELYNAHKSGKGEQEVEKTMKFLIDYTIKHFNAEEELQKKYNYPDYLAHKQLHAKFQEVAEAMALRLHKEGPTDELINHVCVTIGRWVLRHIKEEDLKMTAYIKSKEQNT